MRSLSSSKVILVVAAAFLVPCLPALAQEESSTDRLLVIGTKVAPPFSFEDSGRWTGASIDLWKIVAEELGLQYEIRSYAEDLDALLNAVREGEVDAGVAAITVNGERERMMDFTHPFYSTGYGIAVRPVSRADLADGGRQDLLLAGAARRGPACNRPSDCRLACMACRTARQSRAVRRPTQQGDLGRILVGGRHHDHGRVRRQGSKDGGGTGAFLAMDVHPRCS